MIKLIVGGAEILAFIVMCIGVVWLVGKLFNVLDRFYRQREIRKMERTKKDDLH